MMTPAPRLLIVEDSPDDALLLLRELRKRGLHSDHRRVDSMADLQAALDGESWDLLITDYCLPGMTGEDVLRLAKERRPTLPCIVVSGTIGEEIAVNTMQAGAADYILKHNLARLCAAVEREIREARDRAAARERVSAVETRLESLLDRLDVGVVSLTADGLLLEANRAFLELLGFPSLDAARAIDPATLYANPHDRSAVWAQLQQHGALQNFEVQMRRRDGQLIWVAMTAAITPAANGEPVIDGLLEDITERKQAEHAVRESEERFRQLAHNIQEVFWLIDADTNKLLYVSPTYETVWGRSCQSLYDNTLSFLESVHPNDRPHVAAAMERQAEGDFDEEYRILRPDGAECWIRDRAFPIRDDQGRVFRIAGIAEDITQSRQAEQHLRRQLDRLAALRTIDLAITGSLDLRVTLNVFLDQVTSQLQVDAANVLLLDPHSKTLAFAAGRGFATGRIHGCHIRLGEDYAGQAALEQRFVSIPDLSQVSDFVRAHLIEGERFVTYLCMPLVSKGQVKGVLEIFHRTPLKPDFDWMEFLGALATQASIAIDNSTLFTDLQRSNIELQVAYDATLEGWVHALDLRDDETEGHTQRVTEMTLRLARAMGFSETDLVHLRRGALLHDIGKIAIPDRILLKPGGLDDSEWVVMRRHPGYAFELLSPVTYLRPCLDIPHCHHEKWDGTGYPRGLKGDAIPLAARIFAIIDVWDALLSDRPYRKAWPIDKVMEHIRAQVGTHFDPKVVEAFFAIEPWKDTASAFGNGHDTSSNGANGHKALQPKRTPRPRARRKPAA